jgi:hypothetical protein
MAIDPNIYALSISLDLDTGDAIDSLGDFGDDILKIESQVADVAKKAIGDIEQAGESAIESLSKVKSSLGGLIDISQNVASNLDTKKIQQGTLDLSEKMVAKAKDENNIFAEMIDIITDIQQAIREKNELHEIEQGLIDDENLSLREMFDLWSDIVIAVTGTVLAVDRLLEKIARISEDTEKFVNANYRMYGSQMELLNTTRRLSYEYGIFYDTALEAMQVMGDLRVPRDELETYAKMVSMTNRVTGVAIPTIGRYANQLRMVGRSATQIEKHLNTLQEDMRKFSISADSMTRMLEQSTLAAMDLEFVFKDKDAPEKYIQTKMQAEALAKQLGIATFEAQELDKVLGDPKSVAMWQMALGRSIDEVEDFRQGMFAAANLYGGEMLRLQQLSDKNVIGASAQLQAYRDAYFGGSQAMQHYAMALRETADLDKQMLKLSDKIANARDPGQVKQYTKQLHELAKERQLEIGDVDTHIEQIKEMAKARGPLLKNLKYQNYLLEQARKSALNPFLEANDSLIAQVRILRDRIVNLIKRAWEPLEKALKTVLKFVNAIIYGFVWIGDTIYEYLIKPLNKFTGGALTTFIDLVALGAVAVAAFAVALFGLIPMLMVIPRFLISTAIAVRRFLLIIGRGLAQFANIVRIHVPVLLQLGAAFALVGAGVWLLGDAFRLVTAHGWDGILMFGAMLAIVLAFLIGFALIAKFLTAAVAPLLAFGAAVALVGLGVYLFGRGIQFVVDAFKELINYLKDLTFGDLVDAFKNLVYAASLAGLAVSILLPAAVGLIIASVLISVAAGALIFSSEFLIAGGIMLTIAAGIIAFGAGIFLLSATAIFIGAGLIFLSGIMMASGATMLVIGLGLLVVAGGLMVVASAALWFASFALNSAVAAISPSAIALLIAGTTLMIGGLTFLTGAALLNIAAPMFLAAARAISEGAGEMFSGAMSLIPAVTALFGASIMLLAVSVPFGLAAGAILFAGLVLWSASFWIGGAVARMAKQSDDFYKFADAMEQISNGFNVLRLVKPSHLNDLADAFDAGVPKLAKSVKLLPKILSDLSNSLSSANFDVGPLTNISDSLDIINQAIVTLDQNTESIIENLSNFGPVLEQQAEQIELAAQRIQDAIVNRGVPAIRAAQDVNLAQVQQGNTIATVQVLPNQEGENRSREIELTETTNSHLAKLVELLEAMSGTEELKNITEAVRAIAPNLKENESDFLSSQLNRWGI